MLSNIILLIILLTILLFIWLMWLRQNLLHAVRKVEQLQDILKKDLEKQRDTVPYLLESLRAISEPNDAWRKMVASRASGADFEKELMDFVNQINVKDVNVLEAKKDILDLEEIIKKVKGEILSAAEAFNALKKEFPYTLASAIFGFKEIGIS